MRIFERASAVELIGSRKGALFHLVEDDLHIDKLAFWSCRYRRRHEELFRQQRDIETVGVESGQVASLNVTGDVLGHHAERGTVGHIGIVNTVNG